MSWLRSLLLLLIAQVTLANTTSTIAHPGLDFSELGGQIGVLGLFAGLSFYNSANASAFLTLGLDSNNLYLRNTTDNTNVQIATLGGGSVTQLLQLTEDTVLITGSFSEFNGETYSPPIIYNVSSGDVETIFSTSLKRDLISGTVRTTFVDGELIYMGGDFEYNSTYGAAVYNFTSKQISLLPFQGFGENSTINSIAKYDGGSLGLIIFGGSFDTLGLSELLTHNVSVEHSVKNSTNSTKLSLITAEQVVSLKHATFSEVNAATADESVLICPKGDVWALDDNQGGQWLAELPLEMQGITPTKIRLYVPESGSDGTKMFRLYTYPNNGIMNLTYVDPATNELAYCDAWCPLLLGLTLKDHVDDNKEDREDAMAEDDEIYIGEDGSFTMYYDSSTKSKTLGYGGTYQEFALINDVEIDKMGLTITAWYGSRAELTGLELYLNSIRVYGNDTLNEANCDTESYLNAAVIDDGTWVSVQSLTDSVTDTSYIVSEVTNSSVNPRITLYPNILYAGDYSILFYTPGCTEDGSCSKRSKVNVTVLDTSDLVVATKIIYQNNDNDKFDYLFYGHLNGSSSDNGKNRVTIEYVGSIDLTATDPWVVVDKVVANIVSLDNYYLTNSTNTTDTNNETDYETLKISLNGLFEYSLGNFSDFEESLVYKKEGNETIIELTNTFVGNSTINELSGELSLGSVVNQITLQNSSDAVTLYLLGNFESSSVSLSNDNVLTLNIDGYNSTSNSTEAVLRKRQFTKRDDVEFSGVTFNDSITALYDVSNGYVAIGAFSASGSNSSAFKNLLNDNDTTSTANNFALNVDGTWYSFGNDYQATNFSQFVSIDLDGSRFYVFSSDDGTYAVWDNTNFEWPTLGNLDISSEVTLSERDQQIISGSSFGTMDYYGDGEGWFKNNTQFNNYGLNITSGGIINSFFLSPSLSVVSGRFKANLSAIENVALIEDNVASSLSGSPEWDSDTAVTTLYVDNNGDYLFMGTNGSMLTGSDNVTGLVLYNLANETFSSVQPATLSTNDGSGIEVNAMVYYDTGKQLLVGGHFDNAGSLSCGPFCIYEVENTRWVDPLSGAGSLSISGNVTDAKFLSSNQVLLSGNLTFNGSDVSFAVYSFSSSSLTSAGSALNDLNVDGVLQKYIITEKSTGELNNRMVAYGSGFILGFNGSSWNSIASGIEFTDATQFSDLKLVELSNSNSANTDEEYFDDDQALLLSGIFNLTNYGSVNAALFDGSSWIPYIFSSLLSSGLGVINSLLLEDVYRYQSSSDLISDDKGLSAGKIVGISLACAIGSTALIGLLFLIPMFYLVRDSKSKRQVDQRIHEDDMMEVVNPEDLLHEIDLQRNN